MGRGLQAKQMKVIDVTVWLCYKYNEEKRRPFREVRAAEPGKFGEFAAIYSTRLELDAGSIKFLDICYFC
jgi:hypothetical protein